MSFTSLWKRQRSVHAWIVLFLRSRSRSELASKLNPDTRISLFDQHWRWQCDYTTDLRSFLLPASWNSWFCLTKLLAGFVPLGSSVIISSWPFPFPFFAFYTCYLNASTLWAHKDLAVRSSLHQSIHRDRNVKTHKIDSRNSQDLGNWDPKLGKNPDYI